MNIKQLSLLALSTMLMVACKTKQNVSDDMTTKVISETSMETYNIISTLSSDEYGGRHPGRPGYKKAAKYVEENLKMNGIKPFFETYQDPLQVLDFRSNNIVGLIGEYDPAKPHIVLGAHLDHLGAVENGKDKVYNGADDNASGVTAVLQLAKRLQAEKFDKNIIIALFTAEELGLLGSDHLAKRLKQLNVNVEYMLNFEMLGTAFFNEKNTIYLTGNNLSNCAEEMNNLIHKVKDEPFVKPFAMEEKMQLYYRSDNVSFYNQYKVPCHTLSSYDFENHDHYHKLDDDINNIDVDNLQEIINSSYTIVRSFLKNNTVLKMKN